MDRQQRTQSLTKVQLQFSSRDKLLRTPIRGLSRGPGCAMQTVAWLAGERVTDRPHCTHRELTTEIIRCNDWWSKSERQQLIPILPYLVNTNNLTSDQIYFASVDFFINRYVTPYIPTAANAEEVTREEQPGSLTETSKRGGKWKRILQKFSTQNKPTSDTEQNENTIPTQPRTNIDLWKLTNFINQLDISIEERQLLKNGTCSSFMGMHSAIENISKFYGNDHISAICEMFKTVANTKRTDKEIAKITATLPWSLRRTYPDSKYGKTNTEQNDTATQQPTHTENTAVNNQPNTTETVTVAEPVSVIETLQKELAVAKQQHEVAIAAERANAAAEIERLTERLAALHNNTSTEPSTQKINH